MGTIPGGNSFMRDAWPKGDACAGAAGGIDFHWWCHSVVHWNLTANLSRSTSSSVRAGSIATRATRSARGRIWLSFPSGSARTRTSAASGGGRHVGLAERPSLHREGIVQVTRYTPTSSGWWTRPERYDSITEQPRALQNRGFVPRLDPGSPPTQGSAAADCAWRAQSSLSPTLHSTPIGSGRP